MTRSRPLERKDRIALALAGLALALQLVALGVSLARAPCDGGAVDCFDVRLYASVLGGATALLALALVALDLPALRAATAALLAGALLVMGLLVMVAHHPTPCGPVASYVGSGCAKVEWLAAPPVLAAAFALVGWADRRADALDGLLVAVGLVLALAAAGALFLGSRGEHGLGLPGAVMLAGALLLGAGAVLLRRRRRSEA